MLLGKILERIPLIFSVPVGCQKGFFSEIFKNELNWLCAVCLFSEFSVLLIVCGVCIKKSRTVGTAQIPSSLVAKEVVQ